MLCRPGSICPECMRRELVLIQGFMAVYCHHFQAGAIRPENSEAAWWCCLEPIPEQRFLEIMELTDLERIVFLFGIDEIER